MMGHNYLTIYPCMYTTRASACQNLVLSFIPLCVNFPDMTCDSFVIPTVELIRERHPKRHRVIDALYFSCVCTKRTKINRQQRGLDSSEFIIMKSESIG